MAFSPPAATLTTHGLHRAARASRSRANRSSRASSPPGDLAEESQAWIDRLSPHSRRAGSSDRGAARAAPEGRAVRGQPPPCRAFTPGGNDYDDLAHQSADDALVAVLSKLGDFRGESRFTTWAYKFALLEAGVRVRRRAWQGREVPTRARRLEPDRRRCLDPATRSRDEGALRRRAGGDPKRPYPHQRAVLVAVTLDDVPIDVLAERLETTRGALYKTIHDARRKLRAALVAGGLSVGEYMASASS